MIIDGLNVYSLKYEHLSDEIFEENLKFSAISNYFKDFLSYESGYKFVTIILLVIITIIFYIALSIITKAFKISDITLKY